MPRARNIKPALYENEKLADCSFPARYLFPGLWMLADKEGRLEDRPKRIKAQLLPYDSINVDKLLNELAEKGFITRYKVGDTPCIFINKFTKHQNPHRNEKDSELPPPPENIDSQPVQEISGNYSSTQVKACIAPADSLLLNPDILNPDTLNPNSPTPEKSGDSDFENFWDIYGIKEGKKKAKTLYQNAIKKGATHEEIINGTRQYQDYCREQNRSGQYIKKPTTFLQGEHWKDEYPLNSKKQLKTKRKDTTEFIKQQIGWK